MHTVIKKKRFFLKQPLFWLYLTTEKFPFFCKMAWNISVNVLIEKGTPGASG
jgi:hypothetical protein